MTARKYATVPLAALDPVALTGRVAFTVDPLVSDPYLYAGALALSMDPDGVTVRFIGARECEAAFSWADLLAWLARMQAEDRAADAEKAHYRIAEARRVEAKQASPPVVFVRITPAERVLSDGLWDAQKALAWLTEHTDGEARRTAMEAHAKATVAQDAWEALK